ncbi:hypothetical protein NSK_007973 [Nannochloropsis salina CCMP1776]|uniref:N-acetyltransferase domain-containing protein n=1 Tax=Nannochloropsis salina CCMP1776 TaxID=1027361 RepID=A0A4D9CPX6_9STRA|nr:hypothetical protein NSK_007973 [Nannochloropsis salina CCMP1776]|eukprot:TFJ80796.1 hypothetical protein NSK_007973 [Nannochloropsis salina CCMP1776]
METTKDSGCDHVAQDGRTTYSALRFDKAALACLPPSACAAIDSLAACSARAQGLRRPISTIRSLQESDDHILYILASTASNVADTPPSSASFSSSPPFVPSPPCSQPAEAVTPSTSPPYIFILPSSASFIAFDLPHAPSSPSLSSPLSPSPSLPCTASTSSPAASFPSSPSSSFLALGLLKLGKKHLYLTNPQGQLVETNPFCLLDFFIASPWQRKGLGASLLRLALSHEGISGPHCLAFDRPSPRLLPFLAKNFALKKHRAQHNHFLVYDDFFSPLPSFPSCSVTSSSPSCPPWRSSGGPLPYFCE